MHQHGESVGLRVMPELRQDRFTKEWVFVASEDIKHPHELIVRRTQKPAPSFDPNCPFCPGRENHTAPEILRVPSPKGGWTLRVIPRKFTGMTSELPEANSPNAIEEFGIHDLRRNARSFAHDCFVAGDAVAKSV